MQGLGNDYIYVNTFEETVADPSALAVTLSRPHFGIGADGLVLIGPAVRADFAMRIFNADGSEAEMCGNAVRCIGKYVYERGMTRKTHLTLETGSGTRTLVLQVNGSHVEQVTADMGQPVLTPRDIPVDHPGEAVRDFPITVLGQDYRITCISMGNPHAVTFVDNPWAIDIAAIGATMENHPLFPRRTNVEFVRVTRRDRLEMRVWERGSGETLACGTGAAASVVAAVLNGLAGRSVQARLAGGELQIHWDTDDNHVYQTGPAAFVFDGTWPDA